MNSPNSFSKLDAQKVCKKHISSMERSVHFWSEARGESRKISNARLRCAPHSDAAEALALTIWERMRAEQFVLVTEIDRLLTAHDEIRVAELRETLGQILEAVNVEIKELRAIHIAPIESLTLLLNHIIKIYNQRDVDSETSSDSFVPVSTRIEQMVAKAKELGLGNIEVPKHMYASERAKLAMLEKQIMGKIRLKSIRSGSKIHDFRSKFKIEGSRRRDETKKRLRKVVAMKENLKLEQSVKSTEGKLKNSKAKYKNVMCKYSSLLLKSDGDQTNSYHSLSSGVPQETGENLNFKKKKRLECKSNEDEEGENTSIDPSNWVISSTHKYYFGCSPPVIPKTSVTHEVYPKPVEDLKMTGLENAGEKDLRFFHELSDEEEAHWVAPKASFGSRSSLNKVHGAMEDGDAVREEMSTVSSESLRSFTMAMKNEEVNCEESHGDASTIFAWTEPEKSRSFFLNSAENVVDVGAESNLMHASSDAAGDGCDLTRTKEESSIHTLHEKGEEEPEVQPPAAFSLTDVSGRIDSSCSIVSDMSSTGMLKKNLLSCSEYSEKIANSEEEEVETANTVSCGIQDSLDLNKQVQSSGESDQSHSQSLGDHSEAVECPVDQTLPKSVLSSKERADSSEPAILRQFSSSSSPENPNFKLKEITTVSLNQIKPEKINAAPKYVHPASSASSTTAGPKLSKSIMDELTVEILKRNSRENPEAKRESENPKADDGKDFKKAEKTRSGDFSKGDNIILENSLPTQQSSYDRVDVRNEDSRNGEEMVWYSSPSQDFRQLDEEPDTEPTNQPVRGFETLVHQEPSIQSGHQPGAVRCSSREVTLSANKSVDQFSSAHDFGGTQLLYIRPTCPKTKSKSSKETSGRVHTEHEARASSSTHSQEYHEPATDDACKLGGDPKKDKKRNDMVTLAVLAIALGLGTLGFMTSSGAGNGSIFSEMLGPAGGKALNVIEKALQVLRTLRH